MTRPNPPKACLFDMDGLLLNSETMYTISFSKILNKYGAPSLGWDVKVQLQGLPGPEACELVVNSYNISDKVTGEQFYKETSQVQEEIWPDVELLPGVEDLIRGLHKRGIPMVVCTSSHKDKFELKTKRHKELFFLFDGVVTGDEPAIVGKGKPLPFIWWLGLQLVNEKRKLINTKEEIKPEDCLVFEDAIPGAISGKRAGAWVVWVPDENAIKALPSAEIEKVLDNESKGVILKSLEDFKFEDYGL
ncbi:putative hydrolase [Martiniozyma asiatica (nom. inval.)]|nr:putative hydrolase [Martiniozyma asiatica]